MRLLHFGSRARLASLGVASGRNFDRLDDGVPSIHSAVLPSAPVALKIGLMNSTPGPSGGTDVTHSYTPPFTQNYAATAEDTYYSTTNVLVAGAAVLGAVGIGYWLLRHRK